MTSDSSTNCGSTASDPDTQARKTLPVVVDPGFVRVSADQTIVMNLGRDADLAFLAYGSAVQSVADLGDDNTPTASVQVRPQLNEVVRVRAAPLTAITLAMQILREYAQQGGLNAALVIEQISSWSSEAADQSAEEQE